MLKLLYLTILVSYCSADVAQKYQQCGGESHRGATICEPSSKCYKKDRWYSQCLDSCPAGWECNSGSGNPPNNNDNNKPDNNNNNPPNNNNQAVSSKTLGCDFRFGMEWKGSKDYSAVDYLAIWIGQIDRGSTDFNPYWHGEMLKDCVKYNKLPVYYGYIIAYMARQAWQLKDCDMGSPNLCEQGVKFIQQFRSDIINKYRHYASETAKIIGKNTEIMWLLEPDFWQFYGDRRQQGGNLDGPYMRQLFDDIVGSIKAELPNSKISWDISAWIGEDGMRKWWSYFSSSPHISYIHTSGGKSRADLPQIKQNELSWAFVSRLTGKKIIADTGYGVGGAAEGHNTAYDDVNNLKQRINDGVIAVTQANARNDWRPTLNTLRQSLPKVC